MTPMALQSACSSRAQNLRTARHRGAVRRFLDECAMSLGAILLVVPHPAADRRAAELAAARIVGLRAERVVGVIVLVVVFLWVLGGL
jgi:hypothetical protein